MSFGFEEQGIGAGLEKVRATGAILIVKISDESFYKNIFESEELKARISNNNIVTIGIEFPSEDYDNFVSCYKLGAPPLICFLAPNGVVMEVVRGEIAADYFNKVLNFVLSNIERGQENGVYYPFSELATLPIPVQKSVQPALEAQKETPITTHKPQSTVTKLSEQIPTRAISNICRIKFTLPNGSHISNSFESTTTLAELKLFLLERIPGISKDFVVIRPHPREEFQSTQNESTLRELDISTGSGLIVRFTSNKIAKMPITTWPFFAAIISFFASILSYFFPPRRNIPAPVNPTTNQHVVIPTAKSNTSSRTVGRRGNTHRLSDLRDRDDESNTYNGNSTQQQ